VKVTRAVVHAGLLAAREAAEGAVAAACRGGLRGNKNASYGTKWWWFSLKK
jgi:hypothetical protein